MNRRLGEHVNDDDGHIVAAGLSTKETASSLVDAALASGGRDNVTVIVIDVLA